jgi:peptide/nickel transport system substrate-binding protein
MLARAFKLRFRRRLRLQRRQVEELGQQAERGLERNFFKRLERLVDVRRFVLTWMALLILLGGCVAAQITSLAAYYQTQQAVPGGTYSEGILGAFTNANPLYAVGPVDVTVSRLLFAGLFTYDSENNLVGDLASGFTVDESGKIYTVKLKPNLTWHDGKPLTSADVAFTYALIQNPDARSALSTSWRGITVTATDPLTVTFKLPSSLASFAYSMTNGIVPQHILGDAPVGSLRTLPFNSSAPIGAGPFKLTDLEVRGGSAETREEYLGMSAFDAYHAGRPKLDQFVVHSFRNQERMIQSFKDREINAMVGLTNTPDNINKNDIYTYNMPLTAAVMSFFKVSSGVLADANVRRALVQAADTAAIIKNLDYPTLPVRTPLLQGQIGYNPQYAQAPYNVAAANTLLDEAGWVMGDDGIRRKDGLPLAFALTVQEGSEYDNVALMLKQQWRIVGANVKVDALPSGDFQTALAGHTYDALLHGIAIGKDPDVYVYWDSKSADARSESRLTPSTSASDPALPPPPPLRPPPTSCSDAQPLALRRPASAFL